MCSGLDVGLGSFVTVQAFKVVCCCKAQPPTTGRGRRQHAVALRTAADEWQTRQKVEKVLTLGFLSGTAPIVDLYELKVGERASGLVRIAVCLHAKSPLVCCPRMGDLFCALDHAHAAKTAVYI